jgi:hypothetical protein
MDPICPIHQIKPGQLFSPEDSTDLFRRLTLPQFAATQLGADATKYILAFNSRYEICLFREWESVRPYGDTEDSPM